MFSCRDRIRTEEKQGSERRADAVCSGGGRRWHAIARHGGDDRVLLFPEMMLRLASAPRNGMLMVMRDKPDPRKKIYMPWTTGRRNPMRWVQAEVRRHGVVAPSET
jgi:hypothetical protein